MSVQGEGSPRVEVVASAGANLWTETTGLGERAIVLCHGGPGLSDNLSPVASMIDDIAVVHRYDQRGGARSTGDGPYNVAGFVEDLDKLREHWNHESWIVGGHSWGGWLALMYALKHPRRVSGIVVIGMPPPPSEGWRGGYVRARDARLSAEERAFYADIRRRRTDGEPITEDEERRWVHLTWRTEFVSADTAPDFDREPLFGFPVNREVNRSINSDMDALAGSRDLLADLRSVSVSALFIHGGGDLRPAPASVVAALPEARLVQVDGAGHLPWLERPEEVTRAVREFLGSIA